MSIKMSDSNHPTQSNSANSLFSFQNEYHCILILPVKKHLEKETSTCFFYLEKAYDNIAREVFWWAVKN